MGIGRQQALDCLRSDDLIGIGMEADAVRRGLHPEGAVTYRCVYEIDVRTGNLAIPDPAANLRLICHSADDVPRVEQCCVALRRTSPSVWLDICIGGDAVLAALDSEEIARWAGSGATSIWIDSGPRDHDYAASAASTLAAHRVSHRLGMATTAGIPFGWGESFTDRLDLIDAVRRTHEETGMFAAMVPLGVHTRGGPSAPGPTAIERLKMLAVMRMYLDNIEHLQPAPAGESLKVLQSALRFGADDVEFLPQPGANGPDLRRVVRDAGFMPVERDGSHRIVFLN